MKRRDCIAALGWGLMVAGCGRAGHRPDGFSIVDTPEKRSAYLTSLLDEVSALGPRPAGSPAYLDGVDILRREMERSLPHVELDRFTFERWSLSGTTEFMLGWERIETYHAHGTSGAPPEGIEGIVVAIDDGKLKFAVADASNGGLVAYISSGYERAVPLPFYSHGKPVKSLPTFNIGTVDMPRIERAAAEKTPVRIVSPVRFHPGAETTSVVGSIPGEIPEEILFIAHYDTVYNTVGANDNTASVFVMLMIAHALSGMKLKRTVTFLATEGEEYDKIGAVNYAERRRREGTFGTLRCLINFDSLTWGPNMHVSSEDESLRELVAGIDRDLDIPGEPDIKAGDGFALDGRPFRDTAIRAMYVNSRGYGTETVWHRPEDTPDSVPLDCAEIGYVLFRELALRLANA